MSTVVVMVIMWRQNDEVHRKATAFNGVGTSTSNGKPKIPAGLTLCAVSLSWSRVPFFDDLLVLHSHLSFPCALGWQWMSRTPRPRSPVRTPMNMTSTTFWNPMLELLCRAFIGVHMEALFGDEDFGEDRTFLS